MHATVICASARNFADINNLLTENMNRRGFGLAFGIKDQSHVNTDVGGADARVTPDRGKKPGGQIWIFHDV